MTVRIKIYKVRTHAGRGELEILAVLGTIARVNEGWYAFSESFGIKYQSKLH